MNNPNNVKNDSTDTLYKQGYQDGYNGNRARSVTDESKMVYDNGYELGRERMRIDLENYAEEKERENQDRSDWEKLNG